MSATSTIYYFQVEQLKNHWLDLIQIYIEAYGVISFFRKLQFKLKMHSNETFGITNDNFEKFMFKVPQGALRGLQVRG